MEFGHTKIKNEPNENQWVVLDFEVSQFSSETEMELQLRLYLRLCRFDRSSRFVAQMSVAATRSGEYSSIRQRSRGNSRHHRACSDYHRSMDAHRTS